VNAEITTWGKLAEQGSAGREVLVHGHSGSFIGTIIKFGENELACWPDVPGRRYVDVRPAGSEGFRSYSVSDDSLVAVLVASDYPNQKENS
jgi:hypothetical protein